MTETQDEQKAVLVRSLTNAREALVWKLDGVSDYDVRRPLTASGTNLLGLVKHVALTSAEYFGLVFDRPFPGIADWITDDSPDNTDMWATADQSRDDVLGLWRRAWEHADGTIVELSLDDIGVVPWWPPERRDVSLRTVLVHNVNEIARHAGHADIVRELIDGGRGLRADVSNLPDQDAAWWDDYRSGLQATAERFR